jgi:N-acetylmuramoyl-L-alanine amidase
MKICIDPGHGGHDPGAIGPGGVREKDAALETAIQLARYLRPYSIDPVLTRTTDVFVPLAARAATANDAGCAYFISIHFNSATNPLAQGTETFVATGASPATIAFGQALQSGMVAHLGLADRGIKFANFTVLTRTDMPAALVEPWFLHNAEGARWATTQPRLEALAKILAIATARHLGLADLAPGPAPPEPEEPPTCLPADSIAELRAHVAALSRILDPARAR